MAARTPPLLDCAGSPPQGGEQNAMTGNGLTFTGRVPRRHGSGGRAALKISEQIHLCDVGLWQGILDGIFGLWALGLGLWLDRMEFEV